MTPASDKGFTLLELLVAVAIFALLGVGSYRLLATTIATRDAAQKHDAALMQLQKAMSTLNRDISQAIARPVRNEYGDAVAAVILKNNTLDLTRAGWPNPLQQARSQLQRIHYELNTKGELVRFSWSQLDRERGAKPQQSILLKNIDTMQMKVYSFNGGLVQEWPVFQSQAANNAALSELPRAIEIVVNVKPWGEIRRYFRLSQVLEVSKNAPQ
ncbi:type II secretion system protein GspJ [Moraxellaceae bacterium AER2_44_116]|nr:type II secretion system minor pseudopilin GspJ [Moraxellaceae bacterium]TQC99872.1 type II secretion system protein GspJ [Moraxellaceae bacterium AER2_44_116]